MIQAQISSDSIATSCGITVETPSPVLSLCRKIIEAGCASSAPLEAYRGDTLALHVRSKGEAATLKVNGHGVGFWMGRELCTAPPMRLTAPSFLAA
jgi:hypothetical protein